MLYKAKTARLVITLYRHITDKLPTSYRHLTDTSPTVGRLSVVCRPTLGQLIVYVLGKTCRPSVGRQTADSRPTVGQQSADRRPTVGQQTADSRPTGFLGSSSSQLPITTLKHCVKLFLTTSIHVLFFSCHRLVMKMLAELLSAYRSL